MDNPPMTIDEEKLAQARGIIRMVEGLKSLVLTSFGDDSQFPPLTPRQMALVIVVRANNGISIKELADMMGVTTPSVSTMVDRLVESGVLTRETNPSDRRAVVVRISANVETVIDPLEKHALKLLMELLDRLGPEHARQWHELNLRICGMLEERRIRSNGTTPPSKDTV
jgi:DNA-binding MarR family transcriptional regulator